VSNSQHRTRILPALKPYLWIAGILLILWLGFVWMVHIKAEENNVVLRDMNPIIRWGIAAILGPLVLIFSVHWWGKAVASEKAGFAAYKAKVMAQITEQQATQARTYALEIRGGGWRWTIGINHRSGEKLKKEQQLHFNLFTRRQGL
jgi:hypothetical protein